MLKNDRDHLKEIINKKKREMINIGIQKGLSHKDTLMISQELDQYILQEQSMRLTKE